MLMYMVSGRGRQVYKYWVRVVTITGLLTVFLTELWHFVNVFTSVPTVGHTEAEIKIKDFEHSIPEVVSFNHPKTVNRLISNSELDPAYTQYHSGTNVNMK